MPDGAASIHDVYSEYLRLETLLALQKPTTTQADELLFIVVHQAHELWFKLLLHELSELQSMFEKASAGAALRTLRRIHEVVKLQVKQMDVLETLTPGQFDAFRSSLGSSGFYSAQFREIQVVLGLDDGATVAGYFPDGSDEWVRIQDRTARGSLFDSLLGYLSRGDYPDEIGAAFREAYRRDGIDAQILHRMMDLDQGFQEWRYRHAVLARRVIGDKTGTGGSTGAEFLRRSVFKPSFPPLWNVHG